MFTVVAVLVAIILCTLLAWSLIRREREDKEDAQAEATWLRRRHRERAEYVATVERQNAQLSSDLVNMLDASREWERLSAIYQNHLFRLGGAAALDRVQREIGTGLKVVV